jgi:hypothetical protein
LAEFAIGCALALGFLTPLACLGSLLLLFTYVMSGTASVCAFYALFAIVILATWRTSSWIGVDGLISGYRQRHAAKNDESNVTDKSAPAPKVAARGIVSPTNESFDPSKERVSVLSGTSLNN